jgi:hypothetical protein
MKIKKKKKELGKKIEAHGSYRSPESPWPILKDFSLSCIFFSFVAIKSPQACPCDLGWGFQQY